MITMVSAMVDIHCHILYGTDDGAMDIDESQEMLEKARELGMDLHLGREIMISPESLKKIEEGKLGSMAGSRYILIEFQLGTIAASGIGAVKEIGKVGYKPVIAHVERYGWKLADLLELKKHGAVLQMNVKAGAGGRDEWKSWMRWGLIGHPGYRLSQKGGQKL